MGKMLVTENLHFTTGSCPSESMWELKDSMSFAPFNLEKNVLDSELQKEIANHFNS